MTVGKLSGACVPNGTYTSIAIRTPSRIFKYRDTGTGHWYSAGRDNQYAVGEIFQAVVALSVSDMIKRHLRKGGARPCDRISTDYMYAPSLRTNAPQQSNVDCERRLQYLERTYKIAG